MRIGCLQFAPQVGDVDNNLNRADEILNRANPEDLDLLVLPELAFSGYNFKTLREIYPFLEPTGSGISSVWARTTALKYNCAVAVGYPETADVSHKWPTSPEYYNSLIMVNRDGDAWALYRKSHLYYTDESWALEGPDGFWKGYLPGVGKLALGICMDIKFEAPWDAFEFAAHALKVSANVVIISMAWLTHENPESFTIHPKEPDMETLTYWVKRMEPLIRCENEEEVIVVFANRCGIEDEVLYAGTSAVLGIQNGEVTVYGLLGRGENELLVVDTNGPALAKLVYRPEGETDVSIEGAEQHRADSDTISRPFEDGRETTENTEHDIYSGLDKSPLELVAESSRRAGGHVFIPPAMVSPQMAKFPDHMQDDSPISPRYFWNSHETNASIHHSVPSFGVNSTYEQWRNLLGTSNHSHAETTIDDYDSSSDFGMEPSAEFSALVHNMSHSEATQDAVVSRPFSTKSRNASRGYQSRGTIQTSQYSTGVRTTSVSRDYKSPVPVNSDSRLRKSERNRSTQRTQSVTPPDHRRTVMTPDPDPDLDLERLGADLMVFEKENAGRQKRDSLVCHVDDDDYIVLQTARKDGNSRQKKSSHTAPRTSRPVSRQTPRQPDLGARETSSRESRGSRIDREAMYDADGYEIRPHSTHRERHRSVKREVLSPSKDDKNPYSQRHIRSDVRSPSSRPSRRESGRESRSRSQHKSPPPAREYTAATSAVRDGRHCRQDSHPTTLTSARSSDIHIMFSPDALNLSPRLYASSITDVDTPETGITIPDTSFQSFPLTPKAMILEEKFTEESKITSALEKAMDRMALSCHREATEVPRGRPRSAVL